MSQKSISGRDRRRQMRTLFRRDGNRCHWCRVRLVAPGRRTQPHRDYPPPDHAWATRDHVLPLSKGGTNRLENLVLACAQCNQRRGDNPESNAA